jgi:acetone carboxylase gamma subunit
MFVRDTPELINEIYPDKMGCDPDWMHLREYYDPASGVLLEVEAVPPGYPIVHDFKPDIDTFYKEWLRQPAP